MSYTLSLRDLLSAVQNFSRKFCESTSAKLRFTHSLYRGKYLILEDWLIKKDWLGEIKPKQRFAVGRTTFMDEGLEYGFRDELIKDS